MVRKASEKISGRTIKRHFWEGTPLRKHRVLLPACTRTWHEFTYPQQGTRTQSLIYFWVGSPLLETAWGSTDGKQEVMLPLSNQYLHWNFARWVPEGTGPTHGYRHSSSSEISPPGTWENIPASCATNMYLKLEKKKKLSKILLFIILMNHKSSDKNEQSARRITWNQPHQLLTEGKDRVIVKDNSRENKKVKHHKGYSFSPRTSAKSYGN